MALRVEGGRRYGAMNAAARGISEMALGWSGMVEGRQPPRKIEREKREFSCSKGVLGAQDCSEGCCIIYGRHRSSSGK